MFMLVWIMVIFYAARLKVAHHPVFIFNLLVAIFISILAFVEVGLLKDGSIFINSDEAWFSSQAQKSLSEIVATHSRYLVFVVYSHLTYIMAGEWALKMQSIPFALLTALILYDATGKKNVLWFFPIVFGYIYVLSTLNMRDSMVICAMLFFALMVSRSAIKGILVWSGVATLFFNFVRPEFSYIWILIMIWMLVTQIIKDGAFELSIFPALAVMVVFVFFDDILIGVSEYIYPGRVARYVSDRAEELGRVSFLNDNAAALSRQLLTPLPSSKMSYMLTFGLTQNLLLIELSRMIMMSAFYLMSVALVFKWKEAYHVLANNRFLQVLFVIAVLNTLLYAIYRDGGGSSRNKLYPFIFVYAVFTSVYVFKVKSYIAQQIQKNSFIGHAL